MPTLTCQLTGSGRGGVASIAILGPQALALLKTFFQPASPTAKFTPNRILYGTWNGRSERAGESVVVTPLSEDHFQVHCHGGKAAVEQILTDLQSSGAERCEWSEWLTAQGVSLLQAEAEQVLSQTSTRKTAAIAYDQVRGALQQQALSWRAELLLATSATQSAAPVSQPTDPAILSSIQAEAASILEGSEIGIHLTQPWKVVLAGPPNVGKSSLLNGLLGYRRAITFDSPGTTRDVLSADVVFAGWPIELSDTAGLRVAIDAIEGEGIARAQQEMAEADLILLVTDASRNLSKPPAFSYEGSTPVLSILNKVDLRPEESASTNPNQTFFETVATTGDGLPRLIEAIVTTLVPVPPTSGTALPILPRQIDCLQLIRSASTIESALQAVNDLMGFANDTAA